ncbi:MAG: serine hydrolase domain-containing protein [Gammaproteobacteria bacterium]
MPILRSFRFGFPCVAAATWLLSGPVAAADSSPGLSREQRVTQVFTRIVKAGEPGCATGVMRSGEPIYAAAFGKADIESGVAIDTETVMDIASLSKQFTAFAVLLLEQRKLLSLDDPIVKYLPELAASARGVTLNQLLHHTGGLRDYTALLELRGRRWGDGATQYEALQALARQREPNSPPGTRYEYSNTGYFLLSQIVERVSGQPLVEFARRHIFEPLKMTHTRFVDRFPTGIPRLARGYSQAEGGGFELDESGWEMTGDGRVTTTVGDLAKWDANFYDGRVGGLQLVARMQVPGSLGSGETLPYAMGLMIDEYRGQPVVYHSGWWVGFRSFLVRFPRERLSVSVLCNRSDAPTRDLANAVAEIWLEGEMKVPAEPYELRMLRAKGSSARLEDVTPGLYHCPACGDFVRLAREDSTWNLVGVGGNIPLVSAAPGVYWAKGYGTVHLGVSTSPARVVLQRGYESFEYEPVADWSPKSLQSYVGAYWSEEGQSRCNIVLRQGALFLETCIDTIPLKPASRDELASIEDRVSLRFTPSGAGRPREFRYYVAGLRGVRFERQVPGSRSP